MKKITAILSLILAVCLLAGCAGTTVVYYSDCTCPAGSQIQTPVVAEGSVKTGMAVITTAKKTEAEDGSVIEYDVTVAAVLVDDKGVIVDCVIDSIGTSLAFDADGVITTDLAAAIQTKTELGDAYGMKAKDGERGAKYEWYEQAQALADYAVGKTVEELRTGACNESGKAADADLASTATIYLGGYVAAIEAAAANAQHLGAQAGDELKIATLCSLAESKSAEGENAGNAQLNVDVTAITMNGDVITSCAIDSVQAKVAFGAGAAIEIPASFATKNELGEAYGMKAHGRATYEWNEQAANFAAYVTGKTAAEVAGIAIDETTKPTDADLSASVTISIGGFLALIAKAAQ